MIIIMIITLSPLPLLGTAKPAHGCSTIGQTQVRGRVQEDPLVWSPEVSRLAGRFGESEGGGVTGGSLLPPDSTSPSLPPPQGSFSGLPRAEPGLRSVHLIRTYYVPGMLPGLEDTEGIKHSACSHGTWNTTAVKGQS